MFHVPEMYRVKNGRMASDSGYGNNGLFVISKNNKRIQIIASDGEGWEHVSVSLPDKCPSWEIMCFIKSLFWDAEDTVMQLHPPKSEYVNNHPYCLHLWRPINEVIPMPDSILGGYAPKI